MQSASELWLAASGKLFVTISSFKQLFPFKCRLAGESDRVFCRLWPDGLEWRPGCLCWCELFGGFFLSDWLLMLRLLTASLSKSLIISINCRVLSENRRFGFFSSIPGKSLYVHWMASPISPFNTCCCISFKESTHSSSSSVSLNWFGLKFTNFVCCELKPVLLRIHNRRFLQRLQPFRCNHYGPSKCSPISATLPADGFPCLSSAGIVR